MTKEDLAKLVIKYNKLRFFNDRLSFCMEVLHPISVNSLAKYLCLPSSTILRLKKGKIRNPRKNIVLALAKFFNVNYEWLAKSPFFPINIKTIEEDYFIHETNLEILKIQEQEFLKYSFENWDQFISFLNSMVFYKSILIKTLKFIDDNNFGEKIETKGISQILEIINTREKKEKEDFQKKQEIQSIIKKKN